MNAEDLMPGDYKLKYTVKNPNGRPREDDWRYKEHWEQGMRFRCYRVYWDNSERMALYDCKYPGRMVHVGLMPEIYKLLLTDMERV